MQEGSSFALSNQNLIARFVVPIAGCLMALVLGVLLVSDRDNSLASFMNIVGLFGLLLGAISPRIGLYLLVILCAYLDFIKRFLILFGNANLDDVVHVLRAAPFVLAGTTAGLVFAFAFKRFELKRLDWMLMGLILLLEAAVIASGIRSGLGISSSVNSGVYVPLVIIIPLLFHSIDEMLAFCRFILAVFLPVALYGIWQGVFGLANFEYQYLLSGLTMTVQNLDDLRPRPFSTLNSPHAFQIAMAMCLLLSITLFSKALRSRTSLWNNCVRLLLPISFFTASILSLGRAGWCVWIFGGMGLFAFKTGRRVAAFYAVFLVAFVMLVANAQFIYDRLDAIQNQLPIDSDLSEQAFRIGTYSERLFGYRNVFTNRELVSWFGKPELAYRADATENQEEVVHDALGQLLVSYGIVGLGVALLLGALFLYWAHRYVLRSPSGRARIFSTALLSTVIGVIISGLLAGSSLGLFPINFLFWGLIGLMISLSRTVPEISAHSPALRPGIVRSRYRLEAKPIPLGIKRFQNSL